MSLSDFQRIEEQLRQQRAEIHELRERLEDAFRQVAELQDGRKAKAKPARSNAQVEGADAH